METTLQDLYTLTRERYFESALRLGFDAIHSRDIELKLITSRESDTPAIFFDAVHGLSLDETAAEVSAAYTFVRDFQALAYHRVFTGGGGKPETHFLRTVMQQIGESNRHIPLSEDFSYKLLYAHRSIDTWFHSSGLYRQGARKGMLMRLADARSIAHHVLDWYAKLQPKEVYAIPPRWSAAVALYCLKRANEETTGTFFREWTFKKVVSFGGWDSRQAAFAYMFNAYAIILDGVHDPELLLIDPLELARPTAHGRTQYSGKRVPKSLNMAVRSGTMQAKVRKRRREVERSVEVLLRTVGSRARVEDVLHAIYYEKGSETVTKILELFRGGGGMLPLDKIVSVIEDAWNYFPHLSLGGLSPAEKFIGE